ncbi:hypothetical protein FA15DRAFT_662274 [Coprinopsis marcescibilis]|uniref:Mid2 domain-containing protein n=1 Tax=Coprinopsis marcescibilis TaxID=230819 RepID=A0A5C3LCJ2_COPMA|nr:hypothetical protein FA15DRAFT_662274 [Coprinopsis marcescibilis]
MVPLLSLLCSLLLSISSVSAFGFTAGSLSECDDFSIEWSGGTGPYQLLLSPSFGTPQNISIPPSAFSNGRGSYSMQLTYPKDQLLVLTMSDATGFGAGGSTDVMTVGLSQGGSCNSTDPGTAFPFQLNFALLQCRPYLFEGFGQAIQPVSIWIIVPGGTSMVVQPEVGTETFSWFARMAAGTSAIFLMTDAEGRQGGASEIKTVGATGERSCLDDQALSSTSRPAPASSTRPNQSTTETSAAAAASSEGVPISAIAGTVIGSLLFLAVIVTLGLFFLKSIAKKRKRTREVKKRVGTTSYQSESRDGYHAHPYGPAQPPYFSQSSITLPSAENPFKDSASHYSHSDAGHLNDPFQSSPFQASAHHSMPSPSSADPFNGAPILSPLDLNHSTSFLLEGANSQSRAHDSMAPSRSDMADDTQSSHLTSQYLSAPRTRSPPSSTRSGTIRSQPPTRRGTMKFAVVNPSPPPSPVTTLEHPTTSSS